jgi:hypothetical protein
MRRSIRGQEVKLSFAKLSCVAFVSFIQHFFLYEDLCSESA